MVFRVLKISRVVVSIAMLLLVSAVFVDFTGVFSSSFSKSVALSQLIPELLSIGKNGLIPMLVTVLILILTLLFGRIYCSSICPLGVLQDIIGWVTHKVKRKQRYKSQKNFKMLRYVFLLLSILSFFVSTGYFISFLDPYSNYGRISSMIIKPPIVWLNNMLASIPQKSGTYYFILNEYKFPVISSMIFPIVFLASLLYVVSKWGRLFCNTLCPVGGLLGLISKYSIYKIKIDNIACKSCGVCEWKCKAGCIDKEQKTVDMERCVMCFNCLDTCPTSVMYFKSGNMKEKQVPEVKANEHRRDFLKSVSLMGLAAVVPNEKIIKVYKDSLLPVKRNNSVCPPGAVNSTRFHNACTACYLCISKCPNFVLQPSVTEYGLQGFMQPVLNFKYGYCNFECTECLDICPTGALKKLDKETKKVTQLGVAKFLKDNCVVYTQGTECGACSEHCPTKAVEMVPYKNLLAPQVTEEHCIGCGACEYACPTKPYKAIYVEGDPIHGTATKKKSKVVQPEFKPEEDFPF